MQNPDPERGAVADDGAAPRGRPPVSEQGRQAQRLAISRVAVRLFRDRGVSGTTGADIARAAEVSERTLWRLFRTKESCVEPLLTASLDGFRDVLRSWPVGRSLSDHLRDTYRVLPDESDPDTAAVLAVVRLSHDTPAVRAVWLVLQERAEPTFAEVLGPRLGLAADSAEIRLLAATVNAAFRVVADDVATAVATGAAAPALDAHRRRMAEILRPAEWVAVATGPPPGQG